MEIIKVSLSKEFYEKLPKNIRDFMTIESVDEDDFDYSNNVDWQEHKKTSAKAYKKLKECEFNIRKNK